MVKAWKYIYYLPNYKEGNVKVVRVIEMSIVLIYNSMAYVSQGCSEHCILIRVI